MSRQQHSPFLRVLLALIAVLFIADVIVIGLCLKTPGSAKTNQKPSTSQGDSGTDTPTGSTEETPTEALPELSSTATVTVHPTVYAKLTDTTNTQWHKVLTDALAKNITFATTA